MLTSKYILKILIFFSFFCIINLGLTYILCPSETSSSVVIKDYRQEQDIDTLIVGTSLVRRGINPKIVNSNTNLKIFTIGANSQSYEDSFTIIKDAVERKRIRKIILAIDNFFLGDYNNNGAHQSFIYALAQNSEDGLLGIFKNDLDFRYFSNSRSINFNIPWIYNHVSLSKSAILDNLDKKAKHQNDVKNLNLSDGIYLGRGYEIYKDNKILDYNKRANFLYNKSFKGHIFGNGMKDVVEICKYCRDNKISLTAIALPRPVFSTIGSGDTYFEHNKIITKLFKKYGFEYYDFNMAKPTLFVNNEDYYRDYEHLNQNGSKAFSLALSKLLKYHMSDNFGDNFFCNKKEFLDSINHISIVTLNTKFVGRKVTLYSKAVTGSNTKVEYRFLIRKADEKDFTVFREYENSNNANIQNLTKGEYIARVESRVVGSVRKFDRYTIKKFIIK